VSDGRSAPGDAGPATAPARSGAPPATTWSAGPSSFPAVLWFAHASVAWCCWPPVSPPAGNGKGGGGAWKHHVWSVPPLIACLPTPMDHGPVHTFSKSPWLDVKGEDGARPMYTTASLRGAGSALTGASATGKGLSGARAVGDGGMGPSSPRNEGRGALPGLTEKNLRRFFGEGLHKKRNVWAG
jgi:hypothetical protein